MDKGNTIRSINCCPATKRKNGTNIMTLLNLLQNIVAAGAAVIAVSVLIERAVGR
jgi:hypothetical protein